MNFYRQRHSFWFLVSNANQMIIKNVLLVLSLLVFLNCSNEKEDVIGMKFKNFQEIENFAYFSKVSDTVVYGNNFDPTHGILHLRNKEEHLIVFKSIFENKDTERIFTILDTLRIPRLEKSEFITIGYCQISDQNNENLIAIVDETDEQRIDKVNKVWVANTSTNKIESLTQLENINCWNEDPQDF